MSASTTPGFSHIPSATRALLREDLPDGVLRLHLTRHGRTEFNERQLMQGWSDAPLTEAGLANIRAAADLLADTPYTAAYASSIPRAVRTAEMILEHHPTLRVSTLDDLRELHFGEFESRPVPEFMAHVGDPHTFFTSVFTGTSPALPGGEDGAAFAARTADALEHIVNAHPDGGHVLVVAHGLTLKVLLASAAGPILEPISNAGVSIMDRMPDGELVIRAFNVDASGAAGAEPSVLRGLSQER